MEANLLLVGCLGIVDGSDTEPSRAADAAPRTVRAGSVPPTVGESASESTTEQHNKLNDIMKRENFLTKWSSWQQRESKVQGILRATVSTGILVDIINKHSAKEMWDFIVETHQIDSTEDRSRIAGALDRLKLRNNPTAAEMEENLEKFNRLILEAEMAKMEISENDRIERFIMTFPNSLVALKLHFRLAGPSMKKWVEILRLYNTTMEDIRAAEGKTVEINNNFARILYNPQYKKEFDSKNGPVCFKCGQQGHLKRRCPQVSKCSKCGEMGDWEHKCFGQDNSNKGQFGRKRYRRQGSRPKKNVDDHRSDQNGIIFTTVKIADGKKW